MTQEYLARPPQSPVTVLVASDTCPTSRDQALFESGDTARLLSGYNDLWKSANYSVVNLECPLTNGGTRIEKIGPHLRASPQCITFFKNSGAKAICLANNHIRDYGDEGVVDTLRAFKTAGIATIGAGRCLDEARIPLYYTANGIRVGIVAMAEREFNIAASNAPGANPIDYPNFSLVKDVKERTDFLLVLVHGGTEMLQFPRPGLVELCRFLVDQGAGAVIVQHTHCVGCYEVYKEAPIVYGQGNFIFAPVTTSVEATDPNWFIGMLVELRLEHNKPCHLRLHPFEQSRGFSGIRAIVSERRSQFLSDLEQRSEVLGNPTELHRKWKQYCGARQSDVLAWSLGISGFLWSIDSRVRFSRLINATADRQLRGNMVSCESHRELLEGCLRPEE